MGPQDVSPAARGSAGWGDTACSELLQPLNAPAPPCPPGVWHGHPRRLLGDVPELLSPGWRGWGTLLATDREGEAQKGPQLVLERKEGLSHPYPGAAPSHASRGASPAHRRVPLLSLLVPLIAAAGGEGVSAGTRRSPHISPASSGPAEPLEIRVLLRCRASEELLQSSHPGHLPAHRLAAVLFYMILCLPSNFSVRRQQGWEHPHTGYPQGCGEQRWAVPRRRRGSVAATISSRDKSLRGGGTSAHQHPPALSELKPLG